MCSGIKLVCKDGSVFLCRTLEFAHQFKYSKYESDDLLGILGDGLVLDGLNKYGLCAMAFYYSEYNEYSNMEVKGNDNLKSLHVVEFLLKNARNIPDVRKLVDKITVLNSVYKPWGIVPPLHWMCADKTGECIVLEVIDGVMKVYDNELNVFTNSPRFPEQVMMLQNFPKFSSKQVKDNPSYGTGFLGLPGDFTSPSRFARLSTFEKNYQRPETVKEGINTAFHILNNFDIVHGYTLEKGGLTENTQYTVVYDLKHFDAWSKTYHDQTIRNLRDNTEFKLIKENFVNGVDTPSNDTNKKLNNKCSKIPIIVLSSLILILIIIIFLGFISCNRS